MTFGGFPSRARSTAIPNVFFTDIAPVLADDPPALALALYALKTLQAKHGSPRFVTEAELRADTSLVSCLTLMSPEGAAAIERGLARVVNAGVLLELQTEREGRVDSMYFLNAPSDRRGMEAVRAGTGRFGRIVPLPAVVAPPPSIFVLYEALVGTIGPGIAEELTEAERLYPAEWLEGAFREAAAQNARSWRYVTRILERWASKGRSDAETERDTSDGERYFRGKYGRILRERLEG